MKFSKVGTSICTGRMQSSKVFFYKASKKNTAQMAVILLFNETTNIKLTFYSYLRLNININHNS